MKSKSSLPTTIMTKDALRVLGVAYRLVPAIPERDCKANDLEHDLIFAGLIGMIDPPALKSNPPLRPPRAPVSAPS